LILKWGVNLAKKAFEAMVAYRSVILLADFVFVFARFGFYHPWYIAAGSSINSHTPSLDNQKLTAASFLLWMAGTSLVSEDSHTSSIVV
jgi:hypothetical protein